MHKTYIQQDNYITACLLKDDHTYYTNYHSSHSKELFKIQVCKAEHACYAFYTVKLFKVGFNFI